jgi:hypothetical protein
MNAIIPDLKFLIPFDNQYFLLGINLIQNLIDCKVDKHKIYVVDFGLNKNQLDFFSDAQIQVLKTPAHLIGCHPYKLKSHLSDYIKENQIHRGYLVQLDADMLLLKNPEEELFNIIHAMEMANTQIAICPDMGPKNKETIEIGPSIANFVALYSCPIFKKLLPIKSMSGSYLNTGFVIYAPTFDLENFQNIADHMIGEVVWEQNAINLICAINPSIVYSLDPNVWNLHGKLMENYSGDLGTVIVHITSSTPNSINTGPIHLQIGEKSLEAFYYRQAKNQTVFSIQQQMLSSLLARNRGLFLKHLAIN